MPTVSTISHNKHCNYFNINDNLLVLVYELDIVEQESHIELVPPDEVVCTVFSSLGAVFKKNSSRVHIIHDLSLFMNDFILTRKVSCPTIDDILLRQTMNFCTVNSSMMNWVCQRQNTKQSRCPRLQKFLVLR